MGVIDRIFNKRIDALIAQKSLELSTDQVMSLIKTGGFGNNDKVTDAFSQIPTVYACVKSKAMNISRVPLDVYKGDKKIESGPAVKLLQKINPQMQGNEFLYFLIAAINLRGNGYAIKGKSTSGLPVALWPAMQVKAVTDQYGFVSHYEVTRGKEKVNMPPEEVVNVKFFSPYSMVNGHAPLSVLRQKVELYYAADKYNAAFFQNDATPTSVFKLPASTPPNQVEPLKQQLVDKRRGSRESMVLNGGIEVETIGMSQKDADFLNLYKVTREDICSAFGVPESEIDIYTDTKYSNAQTAAAGYWEKTLIPEADIVAQAMSAQVFAAVGLECRFDFNSIDALHNKGFSDKVVQAEKFYAMGVDFQSINERLNLGFDPDLEVVRPPVATPVTPVPESRNVSDVSEDKTFEAFEHAQGQKWHKMIKSVESLEAKMRKKLKDYFHKVEGKILRAIGSGKGSSFVVNKEISDDEIRAAFSDKELEDAVRELLENTITAGATEIAGASLFAETAQEILDEKLIQVVLTNETSGGVVIDRIREALKDSLADGDGAGATARKLKEALSDAMDINRNRAETIARTEIGGAFNQAGYKASEENGAIGTRWISARDSTVRDTHVDYDGKTVKTGELYGGVIAYPHEPGAPAGEVINCRCMFEPLYEGEI